MNNLLFRAWDINGEGYIDGFNMLGFSTGRGSPEKKVMLQRYEAEWFSGEIILEQYVYAKDTDKRKIFVGDIVEAWIYGGEKPQILEVKREGSGFVIDYEDSESDTVLVSEFVGGLKVIGNKNANPTLLESADEV